MRSKKMRKEANIFADNNKYERNIFKKFGNWFMKLKGWQKGLFIAIIVLLIVAIAAGSYIYAKLNRIDKKDLNVDETKLSCVDVDGYINILLLGVDSRNMDSLDGTNTDAIMVLSINEKTWDVNLISVYRDTYLKIGDTDTYSKVNSAFASGGASQTIKTLNQAMDLNISKYIMVNFKAVSDLVNAVGGITVDVQEEEIQQLNKYTKETAHNIGQKKYNLVTEAGKQKLEGVQAVSYGRIRKGCGDDFKRTERMRIVITKVTEKLKKVSVGQLDKIINLMADQCNTNLSNGDILGLASKVTKYNFNGSTGWPYNVTTGYINEVSYVFPDDLVANAVKLHKEMFGQKDYTASSTLTSIANGITSALSGASNTIQDASSDENVNKLTNNEPSNSSSDQVDSSDNNSSSSGSSDGGNSSEPSVKPSKPDPTPTPTPTPDPGTGDDGSGSGTGTGTGGEGSGTGTGSGTGGDGTGTGTE